MLLGQAFDHLTKRAIPAIGASTDAPLCPKVLRTLLPEQGRYRQNGPRIRVTRHGTPAPGDSVVTPRWINRTVPCAASWATYLVISPVPARRTRANPAPRRPPRQGRQGADRHMAARARARLRGIYGRPEPRPPSDTLKRNSTMLRHRYGCAGPPGPPRTS